VCVHARVRVVDVVSRTASLIIANESLNGQLPTRVTASRTVLSTDRCRSGPARPAPALPCPAGPSTRYAGLQQHPTHVSTIRVLLFLTAAVSGTYPTKRSALKRCLLHSVSKKQHRCCTLCTITSTHINRFWKFLAEIGLLLREDAIERCFVFPPHLTSVSGPPGQHGNAKIAPFKCCVDGLPEFSHLLLDFFNISFNISSIFLTCISYS